VLSVPVRRVHGAPGKEVGASLPGTLAAMAFDATRTEVDILSVECLIAVAIETPQSTLVGVGTVAVQPND
jgi:hypothetical protein